MCKVIFSDLLLMQIPGKHPTKVKCHDCKRPLEAGKWAFNSESRIAMNQKYVCVTCYKVREAVAFAGREAVNYPIQNIAGGPPTFNEEEGV